MAQARCVCYSWQVGYGRYLCFLTDMECMHVTIIPLINSRAGKKFHASSHHSSAGYCIHHRFRFGIHSFFNLLLITLTTCKGKRDHSFLFCYLINNSALPSHYLLRRSSAAPPLLLLRRFSIYTSTQPKHPHPTPSLLSSPLFSFTIQQKTTHTRK